MTLSDLKKELSAQDKKYIARVIECDVTTIHKILNGDRNPDTKLGQRIIMAGKKIVESRQASYKQVKEEMSDV